MAANPHRYPQTHLIPSSKFFDLSQIKDLLCTENITKDVILTSFKSSSSYTNNIHNHFLIIQKSRLIFIRMYVAFTTFLSLELSSCNCDGLLMTSQYSLPKKQRGSGSPAGVIALDSALKAHLSESQLADYVSLKFKYFSNPMVCPGHKELYLRTLNENSAFKPQDCCLNYVTENNFPHKLKVQYYGEKAIVLGINKSVIQDHETKKIIIKHSGSKQSSLENLFSKSLDELKIEFDL